MERKEKRHGKKKKEKKEKEKEKKRKKKKEKKKKRKKKKKTPLKQANNKHRSGNQIWDFAVTTPEPYLRVTY